MCARPDFQPVPKPIIILTHLLKLPTIKIEVPERIGGITFFKKFIQCFIGVCVSFGWPEPINQRSL
jgi:hypothetical protein